MMDHDFVVALKHLEVHGANAITGATYGFPAITHFLGYVHALQRKLPEKFDLSFDGCGVVCHRHQVHAHRPPGGLGFTDFGFALSRNPLVLDDRKPSDECGRKPTKPASFVEEGKMNMDVTLLIAVTENQQVDHVEQKELEGFLLQKAVQQHLAGGVVTNMPKVEIIQSEAFEDKKGRKKILRNLLPGFALVSRHDLLLQDPELAAWMSFSTIRYAADTTQAQDGKTPWLLQEKPATGWITPLAVGYRRISPLYGPGEVKNVRDPTVPACFVENLYSLGQWISPHRITDMDHLFWQQKYDGTGRYLCRNSYEPKEGDAMQT